MDNIMSLLLAVNIGTLAAVVYTLRILVIMERRIAKIMERQGITNDNIKIK